MSEINTNNPPISSLPAGGGSNNGTSLTRFAEDFDDFLTLLITQLQNQDPSKPMDSEQFTDQIVQFTGVEQAINTNQKLDKLIEVSSLSQTSNLLSIVGKEVEFEDSAISIENEGDSADIKFNATLEDENIFVRIVSESGSVVKTEVLGKDVLKGGENTYTWNGQDQSGNQMSAGNYRVEITRAEDNGVFETIDTIVSGKATGANLTGTDPLILVNGAEIPFNSIRYVNNG